MSPAPQFTPDMTTSTKVTPLSELLVPLGACIEAVEWAKKYRTGNAAWKACKRGDWMLWYCGKNAGPVGDERRKLLVLAACECARLALPIWQRRYPDDKRVEICLDTAEKWARNEATLEALQVSRRNCYASYAAAFSAAYASADAAAFSAAYASADAAAYASADAAASAAAYASSAADASAYAAASYAAAAAAYAAYASDRSKVLTQCSDIVRKHYPNPPTP